MIDVRKIPAHPHNDGRYDFNGRTPSVIIEEIVEEYEVQLVDGKIPRCKKRPANSATGVGRPACDVDLDKLKLMLKLGVAKVKIARDLGIGSTTLYRVLERENINV